MGTNFYRIPKVDEVNARYAKLHMRLQEMDRWDPSLINSKYRFIENPEDEWGRNYMDGRRAKIENDIPYIEYDWGSLEEYL